MVELSECKSVERPPKDVLEKYQAYVDRDTSFRANARLLQSIWRIEKFGESIIGRDDKNRRDLGNMLPEDFANRHPHNFLSKTIFDQVVKAVDESKTTGAKIKEPRIWNNLLSSQPLCFNLFAELSGNLSLAQKVLSRVLPLDIKRVTEITFEYSPGRGNPKYTSDRSAFDVFIKYFSPLGESFIGIEVKYSEDLKDKPSSHKVRYEELTRDSRIFRDDAIDKLKTKPLQQIWRDHLLSLSLYKVNKDFKNGIFVYLYPKDNFECYQALKSYIHTFKEPSVESSGFYPVTLEQLTGALKALSTAKWIRDFDERYLNFEKLKSL